MSHWTNFSCSGWDQSRYRSETVSKGQYIVYGTSWDDISSWGIEVVLSNGTTGSVKPYGYVGDSSVMSVCHLVSVYDNSATLSIGLHYDHGSNVSYALYSIIKVSDLPNAYTVEVSPTSYLQNRLRVNQNP